MILPRSFYARDTVTVARELLGCHLVHETKAGVISGKIVETEAYLGRLDAAAHAYKGERPHTRALFQEPGTLYIYFTYGMHYCANVVTNQAGLGEAVLFRALEPVSGIELMQTHRGQQSITSLANGPAKLVQACQISPSENGQTVLQAPTYITSPLSARQHPLPDAEIVTTTRVGITKAATEKLRFYIKNSQFISKK